MAVVEALARLHACHAREAILLEAASSSAQSPPPALIAELRRLCDLKRELVDILFTSSTAPAFQCPAPAAPQLLHLEWDASSLHALGSAVFPVPVVTIDNWAILSRSTFGSFVMSAAVVSAEGSAPSASPLQGQISQPVDATGIVTFPNLRFPEHTQHSSLRIIFTLQETSVPTIPSPSPPPSSSSSSSLHALLSVPLPPAVVLTSSVTSASSSKAGSLRASSSSDSLLSGDEAEPSSMPDMVRDMIDISDLLLLPQKTAAQRLGLSESMLCKRFKESTRRKWPYRTVQKLDKLITALRNAQTVDGTLSLDDRQRLERLIEERERCLRPVRIRVAASDRAEAHALESLQLLAATNALPPSLPAPTQVAAPAAPFK